MAMTAPRTSGWATRGLPDYYDHQSRLGAEIARQEHTVRQLRSEAGESPLVTRLRACGLLV
jgi:hypothetical protein